MTISIGLAGLNSPRWMISIWSTLDEEDDEDQYQHLGQHRTGIRFRELVRDAQT